jgi:single-strand DNA-binding protein
MIQALNKVLLLGCIAKPVQAKQQTKTPLSMLRLQISGIPFGDSNALGWTHTVYVMGELAQRTAMQLEAGTPVLVEGSFFYSETKKNTADQDKKSKNPKSENQSTLRVRATRVMRVERAAEDVIRDPQGGFWLKQAVNQVSLIGNVTRDALNKQRRDGSDFVLLPVALNESWRNRDGTQERRSHFVPVICADRNAQLAALVKRGEPVLVNGSLMTILRPDPSNPTRSRTTVQVAVENLELLQGLATVTPEAIPTVIPNPVVMAVAAD